MDLPDFDNSDPAPPPYSHQEFDAKVDLALEVSTTTHNQPDFSNPLPQSTQNQSQQTHLHNSQVLLEEEWQEWNEDAFKAAEQSLKEPVLPAASSPRRPLPIPQPGASSSSSQMQQLPVVQPLNVQKRVAHPQMQIRQEKQGSSWLQETPSDRPPPIDSHQSQSGSSQDGRSSGVDDVLQSLNLSDMAEPLPPPPFAAVGPSLDGPAYQEFAQAPTNTPMRQRRQSPINRSYSASPPPSPLHQTLASQNATRPTFSDRSHHSHMSLPPPTTPSIRAYTHPIMQRTTSAYETLPVIAPPRPFETANTYHESVNPSQSMYTTPKVDASAFYNSSVSSMFIRPNNRPRTSHGQGSAILPPPTRSMSPQTHGSNQFYSSASLYKHPYANAAAALPPSNISPTNISQQGPPPVRPPGARAGINPQLQASGFSSWNR